jgi:hypothetical protein
MAYMPEFPTYFNGLDRLEAAPEFTIEQWPASVQVQSKHFFFFFFFFRFH